MYLYNVRPYIIEIHLVSRAFRVWYNLHMTEFVKMDVFFFVTTVVVIALAIVALFIGLKLLRILAHVERIIELAAKETELIKEDIDDFRADVRRRGFGVLSLARFISNMSSNFTRRSRKKE